MRWASAISDRTGTEALDEALAAIESQLQTIDLAIVFAAPDLARAIAPRLATIRAGTVIGCSGAGIIGDAREIEDRPALSITAAELPGVRCAPFRVDPDAIPVDASAWRARVGADDPAGLLVFTDPFSCDTQELIAGLDDAFPRTPKLGGLVSGSRMPGAHWLYTGGTSVDPARAARASHSYQTGAVGVALSGALAIDTVVAQGCRPVGAPMVVTRCDGNLLHELDGKSPLEVLQALLTTLSPRDQQLLRHSLFVGIEMQDSLVHREGELLVRNIVGVDQSSGALAVATKLRPYQVIRFLLRDAEAATSDLASLLERHRAREPATVEGALLFSCLGRGARLFGEPDHDTALFQRLLGPVPIGGFFCNGEIGPVGGTTFLHAYTSSFALFRRPA